jgi:hypothetical protein
MPVFAKRETRSSNRLPNGGSLPLTTGLIEWLQGNAMLSDGIEDTAPYFWLAFLLETSEAELDRQRLWSAYENSS